MHHYFEAITNTSGDSLVGYFARVINPANQNTVTLSADDNGTPISTISGIENMAVTDAFGNLDFYVEPGTYHLDIYAPNATSFIMRVPNVAMNSTKGDKGDIGDQGEVGAADAAFATLAQLKTLDPVAYPSPRLAAPSGSDGGILNGAFTYQTGSFTAGPDVVLINGVATGAFVRTREAKPVPLYATPYNRITSDRALDRITLGDFGAEAQPVGVGNADWDTNACNRAVDFMANYRDVTVSPGGSQIYTGPAMRIPKGRYFLSRPMTADVPHAERILFRGDGKNATVIRTMGDFYAIQSDSRLESTYISDLTAIGGKGFFRHTFTGDNVSQKHIIRDCFFFDYSESAISSEARDMPYWGVLNCIFGGGGAAGSGLTRGIVLGGLQDGSIFAGNEFQSNEYHIVLGALASGSFHILYNDFLSTYSADRTRADIWLRPHDGSISAASPAGQNLFRIETGNGSTIKGNKFGSEGITSFERKAPKILVAAGTAGTRAASMPDLTWKDGTDGKHYLGGITVDNNRFVTTDTRDASNVQRSGADANVMDVWVNGLNRITWGEGNSYDGSSFRYVVEHKSSSRVPDKNNMSWNVTIPTSGVPVMFGFTNSPVGLLTDRSGSDAGGFSIVPGAGVDPTAVTVLAVTTPDPWTVFGGVTKAATTNIDGQNDATRFTFNGSGAAIQLTTGNINANANRAGSVVTAYRSDTARQMRFTAGANGRDFIDRVITLPASPGRYAPLTIPLPLPGDVTGCVLTFTAITPVNGSILDIGDFKLGAGKSAPTL